MKFRYKKINKLDYSIYNLSNEEEDFKFIMNKINSDEIDYIIYHSSFTQPIFVGKYTKTGLLSKQVVLYTPDYLNKVFSLNSSKIGSVDAPTIKSSEFNTKTQFLINVMDSHSLQMNVPYLGDIFIFKTLYPEQCAIFNKDKLLGLCFEGTITLKTNDIKEISILISLFYFLFINSEWKPFIYPKNK